MNELQLIRSELAAQRRHARELAASLTSNGAACNTYLSIAYDNYLLWIIDTEAHRSASHLERLRSRSDLSDAERRLIERCAGEFDRLTAERASASAVARKADLMTRLCTLAEQLEAVAQSRYGLDDWRRAAHLDADSILAERRLRKSVSEQLHGRISG